MLGRRVQSRSVENQSRACCKRVFEGGLKEVSSECSPEECLSATRMLYNAGTWTRFFKRKFHFKVDVC